jgi:membrane-bound metal-dependent hydrolase YbcI (DUF457 family)
MGIRASGARMGPGHLGLGFAAKPTADKVPLWLLLIATEVLDILSFIFEALGIERFAASRMDLKLGLQIITPGHIPWSHGLFMSIVWSLLAGWIAYRFYRDSRTGVVVGSLVFSHWVLDFLVHPPDLPLFFKDSPLIGLGLWTSGPGFIASMIIEVILLAGGIALYFSYRKRSSHNLLRIDATQDN